MEDPRSFRLRRRILGPFALVAIAAFSAPGCVNHRVLAIDGDPDRTTVTSTMRGLWLWGLLGDANVRVGDCESRALHLVRVRTTFLQGLASVLTLGIWLPATVEWQCATVDERSGPMPIPPADGDDDGGREIGR